MVLANLLSFLPTTLLGYYLYRSHTKSIVSCPIDLNTIKGYLKFGVLYSISLSIQNIQDQINYGILNLSPAESTKTYYNIAKNFTGQAVGALNLPIGPVLTDLYQSGKHKEMVDLFSRALSVSTLILSLISGLLFYILDVYILVVFPPEYASITPIIRNSVFSIITMNIINNYAGLLLIMKREKDLIYLYLFYSIGLSVSLLIGFQFMGLLGFIIGQIVGSIIGVLFFWYYGYGVRKDIMISLPHLFKHYLFLVLIIVLSNIISNLFLSMVDLSGLIVYISNLISQLFGFDIINQIGDLVDSSIRLVSFLMVFLIIQFSFIRFNRDDLRSILSTGINFPFKNVIVKFFRLN